MSVRVSVIVANLDGETLLPDLLDSLALQSLPPGEILVVDDGSRDFSCEVARARTDVRLIELGRNRGASAARNAGTLAATGDILAFVDNDSVADRDWIAEAAAALDRHPSWGALGSMVHYHANADVVNGCGADLNRSLIGRDHGFGRPVSAGAFPEEASLYAMSNGLFVRRAVAQVVGPWDEAIPYYYEDTDFCLRIRMAGFEVGRAPRAVLRHKLTVSSGAAAARKAYVGERHRIRMALKYLTLAEGAAWFLHEWTRGGGRGGGRTAPIRLLARTWGYNLRHLPSAVAFRWRHPPRESRAWRTLLDPSWGGRDLAFHNFRPSPVGCRPRDRIDAIVHAADWRYGVHPVARLDDGSFGQWLDGESAIDVTVTSRCARVAADLFVPEGSAKATAHLHLESDDGGVVVWRTAHPLSSGSSSVAWEADIPPGRYRLFVRGEPVFRVAGWGPVLMAYSRLCFCGE